MTNTLLQVTKISEAYTDLLKPSFNNLPETDHADGKYRLRKYSRVFVSIKTGITSVSDLKVKEFTQSSKYNKHQGDVQREFVNIDSDTLNTPAMRAMVGVFRDACNLGERFTMDIHQMRAKCKGGGATQLAPEGWHQDGYDCLAITGVHRSNIVGGEILLATSKTEEPFMKAVVGAGTMVIIDDSVLWHNGRSIQPVDEKEPAWMDVFIFTARK